MRVSLNWLKEYVEITVPVEELADKLTMAGFEVESIENTGSGWENVFVGQIIAVNPHPNADRLTLPTIDLGDEQATVVCGAPNLKVGDKIAFARVGARLIDPDTREPAVLKTARIRGVASSGMVCSERELGISDSHEGIMVLPDDALVGTPLADYIGDIVLDIDVTPNRADCLSVIGVAREVAALTGQTVQIPEVNYRETEPPIDDQITIEISAPDLCPRYCASLITGVRIAESPAWMQQRLIASGMRPINNLVDVTNYVMLEYGQPLHSFDYEKIRGKKIIARRASDYEPMTTLDDNERELNSGMLVIADVMGAVAVAGVMGGVNSEVTEETTSILLEAASFNPKSIHYTGRTLGIPSEACMRFERNISRELTLPALRRATQLLAGLGGGEVARSIVDVYPEKLVQESITLSTGDMKRCIGIEYSLEQIISALTSLGFECKQQGSAEEAQVTAPYWRTDIRLKEDLIEEVARVIGYDEIPITMLSDSIPRHDTDPIIGLKREVRNILAGLGFQELMTFSLAGLEMLKRLFPESHTVDPEPIRVTNPMTTEQEYLRSSLRPNILVALSENRKHEDGGIRIYELGKVYLPGPQDLPDEHEMLCGLLSGPGVNRSWQGEGNPLDFFEAKGVVESLITRLGVEATFVECMDESLRPGRRAAITVDDNKLGVVGEFHPRVLESFDINEAVYIFEIDLPELLRFAAGYEMYRPIPRFPAVVRDLALVVDAGTAHQKIVDIIKGFPLVKQVDIFDFYSGGQVPEGKKSLAYRITYQSIEQTLTDKEVGKVQKQILDRLAKDLGATLRV